MATANEVGTAVATQQDKPKSLESFIKASLREIGRALPKHMNAERVGRIALTCIRLNPSLMKCTPESFMGALFVSAQLGIEPIAGRAYILPYANNRKKEDGSWHKVYEAQFMMGFKGLVDLFYRHEKSVELGWGVVHENDYFDYENGTSKFLKHKQALTNRGKVIAYWVGATLMNGGKVFHVMSMEECMAHGQMHSKTFVTKEYVNGKQVIYDKPRFASDSPWNKEPESMCLKTVLIQLMKILPMSVELQRAIQADESSRDYRKGIDDALDLPNTAFHGSVEAETVPAQATVQEDKKTTAPATSQTPAQDAGSITDRLFPVGSRA